MNSLVSVIITTYKTNGKLKRAIESVLNQSYKYIEIIVIDDNSNDTKERNYTETIMEEYQNNNKVKYIKHDINKNGAAARNTGINIAQGKYLAFLDDDDFYLPTKIEKCVEILQNNLKYKGVYSSVLYIQGKKYSHYMTVNRSGNLQKELLRNNNMLGTGSNLFIDAECIKKLKGFDEDFLRFQDVEFMIRFFDYYEIKHIDEILVVKDVGETGRIPNYNKFKLMVKIFFSKFEKTISKYEIEEQKEIKNTYLTILYNVSILSKDKKNILEAENNLKKERKITKIEKLKKCIKLYIPFIKKIRFNILKKVKSLTDEDNYNYIILKLKEQKNEEKNY